jgi:chromosome segregation ATPase
MIVSLLKSRGMQLKSTLLLSLATRIGADPLAKVKKLIQELIERLLTEAANEANQKGWCDKATADAEQKRDMAVDKSDELNARMAKLEATRDKLTEELKVLTTEMIELTQAQVEAQKMRKEEKAENAETVYQATMGLDAIQRAIEIIGRFYKTADKAEVDLDLLQGPMDDAPETSFKTGSAYKGVGGASGGIVGMMQVIESDFIRTIKGTKQAEKDAIKEFNDFMTESSMSLAEKKMASEQKTKYKTETVQNLDDDSEDLIAKTSTISTSIEELIKLKGVCVDTGMSYADRVAAREEEIAALKKALCIFNKFAEYGPDGLSDAC